jgi:LPXTG-site transpeptidase (sortase) family protein
MPRSFTVLAAVLLLGVGVALVAGGGQPRTGSVAPVAIPGASAEPSASAAPTASPVAPTPMGTIGPIPDGYRVRLPRLGIDLPIAEGDIERDVVVQKTPENFAFHFPGTAIPGTFGNSYLYAHARTGMFLELWKARVGDQVTITTPAGAELKFVVTEVHPRVPPDETSWLQPSGDERLTLQTSTGPNRGDPRFVVIAAPA